MYELVLRIARHFTFDSYELRDLLGLALLFGFMFSFRQWQSVGEGIGNLLVATFFCGCVLTVRIVSQKIWALREGFAARFRAWWPVSAAGLLICVLSNGRIVIPMLGGMVGMIIGGLRLGKFRYGLGYADLGKMAAIGTFSCFGIAILFKFLGLESAVFIATMIACFSLLPIPRHDGLNLLFASRLLYVFTAGACCGAAFLLFYASALTALFGSIVAGVITIAVYYIFVEKKL